MEISRRTLLTHAARGAAVLLPAGLAACAAGSSPPSGPAPGASVGAGDGGMGAGRNAASSPERPPALPADEVRSFVGVAHGNLAEVRTMLAATPSLLNATWDWGGGDFETALGAASHTGSREIAELLLDRGARLDLFAATMLGRVAVVEPVLRVWPGAVGWDGPHGLSLLHHAERGGHQPMIALVREAASRRR